MTDFLTRLAHHALGLTPVVKAGRTARYSPEMIDDPGVRQLAAALDYGGLPPRPPQELPVPGSRFGVRSKLETFDVRPDPPTTQQPETQQPTASPVAGSRLPARSLGVRSKLETFDVRPDPQTTPPAVVTDSRLPAQMTQGHAVDTPPPVTPAIVVASAEERRHNPQSPPQARAAHQVRTKTERLGVRSKLETFDVRPVPQTDEGRHEPQQSYEPQSVPQARAAHQASAETEQPSREQPLGVRSKAESFDFRPDPKTAATVAQPLNSSRAQQLNSSPITIHIDRIDVRANAPDPPTPTPPAPAAPRISLDEFLNGRSR